MSEIQVTATLKIKPGQLDAFKAAANDCVETVRANDKGTTQYDWFFSGDQSVCIVRECYKDSGAVLAHVGNLGDKLGTLLSTCDLDLEVFGKPSGELQAALDSLGAKVYAPYLTM